MAIGRRTSNVAASVLLVGGLHPVADSALPIPRQAATVIHAVSRAAAGRDGAALRSAMHSEFIWSFGGDANAEQAIDEWFRHPHTLRALSKATQSPCAFGADKVIECPARAGSSHRAGFQRIHGEWKMVYFVAGD